MKLCETNFTGGSECLDILLDLIRNARILESCLYDSHE